MVSRRQYEEDVYRLAQGSAAVIKNIPVRIPKNAAWAITHVAAVAWMLGTPALAQENPALRFVMPTAPATYLLPYFVSKDLGWLKDWGADTSEQVVSGDPNALRAVIAGSADITFIGPPTIMDAVISGAKIKAFCSWQPITDYQFIAGSGKGASISDLADKRIAATGPGSMTMYIPQMLLKKGGIDTSNMKFLSVGGMSARLQAVVADKVDATLVDTFFATKAERAGTAQTVASVAKEFPGLGYVYAVAKEETLDDPARRKSLDGFVRGCIEGSRFVAKNSEKAAEILKRRLPDEDSDLIRATIEKLNILGVWGVNGGLEHKVIEFSTETFFDLGMIKRKVSYEEVVDPSFVDRVIAEVGRM
jgi:NitT/TauT family transport system substrate-binding protein